MEKTSYLEKNNSSINSPVNSIWHPYTQERTCLEPIHIQKAKGAILYSEQGEEIIDAISSWWVTLHGHNHPYIIEKITEQMTLLDHVIFAGFTHNPAKELANKLLSLLPPKYSKLFYSDNGSTSVETALKIAFQYWHNKNQKSKKKKVIAFKGAYHGDTFGAMSVSGRDLFTKPFLHALFDVIYITPPIKELEEESLKELHKALQKNDIACFIFEPIVQGVYGMRKHSEKALDNMIKYCHEADVITIADEVMTGLGRIGPNFAIEKLVNKPDILCLAKSLTGGILPFSITVSTEKIYNQFLSTKRSKALLHGHSYSGNPLGCVASLASLQLLDTKECLNKRLNIEEQHKIFFKKIKDHPKVQDTYVIGTILVVVYKSKEKTSYFNKLRDRLALHFRKSNILIRPFGNTIHVLPPYCISKNQLEKIYRTIEKSFEVDL